MEHHMADITNAELQESIADSLLDDSNIIATLTHEGQFIRPEESPSDAEHGDSVFDDPGDYFAGALYDQEHDAAVLGDDGLEQKIEQEQGRQPQEAEDTRQYERQEAARQPEAQPEAEQSQPLTPEAVQAGIQALETAIEQHQLNDAPTAKAFADEFCGALGTDIYKAGIDVQALGNTVAKTALSAMQVYEAAQGNLQSLPAIPAESARAFSFDLLKGLGIDPRTVDVDSQLLSQTVLGGVLNFYSTYEQYGGRVADLSKLNDPRAAEMFLGNFMKALGNDQPVNRQTAIKVADALGNYLLGFIGKINAANQRQAEARQGQGARSNTGRGRGQRVPAKYREGIKGSKAPKFETNLDIFGGGTMDFYHQQHGRL